MTLAARTPNRRRSNKLSLYLVERPAVLEVGGDARRTKRMIADLRRDLGRPRSPLNHRLSVRLGHAMPVS
jgi:hypothetical protein